MLLISHHVEVEVLELETRLSFFEAHSTNGGIQRIISKCLKGNVGHYVIEIQMIHIECIWRQWFRKHIVSHRSLTY